MVARSPECAIQSTDELHSRGQRSQEELARMLRTPACALRTLLRLFQHAMRRVVPILSNFGVVRVSLSPGHSGWHQTRSLSTLDFNLRSGAASQNHGPHDDYQFPSLAAWQDGRQPVSHPEIRSSRSKISEFTGLLNPCPEPNSKSQIKPHQTVSHTEACLQDAVEGRWRRQDG